MVCGYDPRVSLEIEDLGRRISPMTAAGFLSSFFLIKIFSSLSGLFGVVTLADRQGQEGKEWWHLGGAIRNSVA